MKNLKTAGDGGTPIPRLDTGASSVDYPYGKTQGDNPPGSNTGTPIRIEVGAEPLQAFYAILKAGGVTPNGEFENVTTSDAVNALKNMFFDVGDIKLRYSDSITNTNWLPLDGEPYDPVEYPELHIFLGSPVTPVVPNFTGRVPVGFDSGDSDFDAIGKTIGEKTHVLTESEMPIHNHTVSGTSGAYDAGSSHGPVVALSQASSSAGGDEPHNNMQPSKVVQYFIKAK